MSGADSQRALERWMDARLLKADLFSRVVLGAFRDGDPAGSFVLRDARAVRWWARWIAGRLQRREIAGLVAARTVPDLPRLLFATKGVLVRSWIPGEPMHVAQPRDPRYFRSAFKLLVALHRRKIVHNDLAKEANWLVLPDGRAAVIDFQLSWVARRRGRMFRVAAREDLRHLLKHKRTYCPQRLTLRERQILARRSLVAEVWRRTGKVVYLFVTRRLLRWSDREGANDRQFRTESAPPIPPTPPSPEIDKNR